MEYKFIDFWHLYAPQKEFKNRYQCCERVWNVLDERKQRLIMLQLEKEQTADPPVLHKKNPYFFLTETQRFGTVTKEDAETYGLEVHHWM